MIDNNNASGSIIQILANLPDFLRKPMLQSRLREFYTMSDSDKGETINMALSASSAIDQNKLAVLFRTWLEVLSEFDANKRIMMFQTYCQQIILNPHLLQRLDLNLLTATFLSLESKKRELITDSLYEALFSLHDRDKILSLIPDDFLKAIGLKR